MRNAWNCGIESHVSVMIQRTDHHHPARARVQGKVRVKAPVLVNQMHFVLFN